MFFFNTGHLETLGISLLDQFYGRGTRWVAAGVKGGIPAVSWSHGVVHAKMADFNRVRRLGFCSKCRDPGVHSRDSGGHWEGGGIAKSMWRNTSSESLAM